MPLVAHYPLQEDSGSTANDVRGGNDGSINGGVTLGANGILGTSAFDFNGSDGYIDIPALPSFNRYTVSCWVRSDNPSGGEQELVTAHTNNQWNLVLDHGSYPQQFQLQQNDGSWKRAGGGPTVQSGTWYQVVGTWDSSNLLLYVDGVLVGSDTASSGGNGAGFTEIGAWTQHGLHFDGTIADVRIYDHALTAAEIQYLHSVVRGKATIQLGGKPV